MTSATDMLREVSAIIGARQEDRYHDADLLLDRVRADRAWLFRSDRWRYALCRARLAAARGHRNEAAAFACGALWQLADDEHPEFPRHPDVGRIVSDEQDITELRAYVEAGDPEAYDALTGDYRSPSNGRVQWHWSHIERLRPNRDIVGPHRDRIAGARAAAEPLLLELRSVGIPAYDLDELAKRRLPSRKAAEILVKWIPRIKNPLALTHVAIALTDRRARSVATAPLLTLFRELQPRFEQDEEMLKDRVGNALATLDDDQLGGAALRALADLRSERARPPLERIAAEPTTRARSDAAQEQRRRVQVAQKGLAKLDRAAAR